MSLPELVVPHRTEFDFGIGVDAASLAPRLQAVDAGAAKAPDHSGVVASQSFHVTRIQQTSDLQSHMGISASGGGGAATFGVGASARVAFCNDVQVHTQSLFLAITCTIQFVGLSIATPALVAPAAALADRQDVFLDRYGNMFCRACDRGGLFIGVLQIDTQGDTKSDTIAADLTGTYGFFSADVSTKFSTITSNYKSAVYCSMYAEGGPPFNTQHPDDPQALLDNANAWFKAFRDDPDSNAVPYTWYLSPLSMASGPVPPDEADIGHAQDVLTECARQRLVRIDQLNLLDQYTDHPERFVWPTADATGTSTAPTQLPTRDTIKAAATAAQADLDLIASCASNAMTHVAAAKMPGPFATSTGTTYPSLVMPDPLPALNPALATSYFADGQAIANSDELVAAVRNSIPDGPERNGFDTGMAAWRDQSLPGPGKTDLRNSLPVENQAGFDAAAAFSQSWNTNVQWAAEGAAVVKADPAVAAERAKGPVGLYWLGFNIGTGLFGDPKLGAEGHTSNGPGAEQIRSSLAHEAQEGYNAAVNFNLQHRNLQPTWITAA